MLLNLSLSLLLSFAVPDARQTACDHEREEVLALDFVAFDQTEGSGWRPLYRAGCYAQAAQLLRDWRERNESAPNIILFHEAQMWAYAGNSASARELFAQTYRDDGSVGAVTWNLYVDGNLAFLQRDRAGLEAAAAALESVPKPSSWDKAVDAHGQPIALPWPLNLNVLEAMLRCWDATYEIAAHCHISGWQRPDPVG